MANGFQKYKFDPRVVVKEITDQMNTIVKTTTKKLGEFDDRLSDDEEELDTLNSNVNQTNQKLDDLAEEVSKLNQPEYDYDQHENIIGIRPRKETPYYKLHADRSDKDGDGRVITDTYVTKTELADIDAKITELSGKSVKYLGEMAYSSFSGLNPNHNDEYTITGVGQWKRFLTIHGYTLRVSDGDSLLWNGNRWIHYTDNDQTNRITDEFINNLDWGV